MSAVNCGEVKRTTRQPNRCAAKSFSESFKNPPPRVWRPFQTPPSISIAVLLSRCAKSNRQRRGLANTSSRSRCGPPSEVHRAKNFSSRCEPLCGCSRTGIGLDVLSLCAATIAGVQLANGLLIELVSCGAFVASEYAVGVEPHLQRVEFVVAVVTLV